MNEELQWIEDVESVSERIKTPMIPTHVLERIQAIPSTIKASMDTVPKRTIWLVAASIAALIVVNIYVSNSSKSEDTNENYIAEMYFSHLNTL